MTGRSAAALVRERVETAEIVDLLPDALAPADKISSRRATTKFLTLRFKLG